MRRSLRQKIGLSSGEKHQLQVMSTVITKKVGRKNIMRH